MSDAAGHKNDLIESTRDLFERPDITLVFSPLGSGGSYLLYSLVDNDPQIHTFPHDIRRVPLQIAKFDEVHPASHIAAICENNERFFDASADLAKGNTFSSLGQGRNESLRANREVFVSVLSELLDYWGFSLRNLIFSVVVAYARARGHHVVSRRIAIFTHDFANTVLIFEKIGECRLLGAIRHPLRVYQSQCLRHFRDSMSIAASSSKPHLPFYLPSRIPGIKQFYKFLQQDGPPIWLLPLEQLHAAPEASMRAVSTLLGIEFSNILLRSTVDGKLWWGSTDRPMHGFDAFAHRRVRLEEFGCADGWSLMQATLTLCRHIGYTRRTSLPWWGHLCAKLLSTVYLRNRFALFVRSARGRGALSKLALFKSLIRESFRYCRVRIIHENDEMRRIAIDDANAKVDRVRLVHHLQDGAIHFGRWL